MQETFEHNISQQLDDFKLQPSPIVWQEVDAALHPKRKRRIIIWWWLGAAILAIGALGFWATFYSSTNTFKTITNNAGISNSVSPNTQTPTIAETKNRGNDKFKIDKQEVITFEKQQKALFQKPSISLTINNENTNSSTNNKATTQLTTNTNRSSENTDNVMVTTEKVQPSTLDLDKKIDSNTITAENKHDTDTSRIIPLQKKSSKSSRWIVTVGGGILQTSQSYRTNGLAFSNSAAVGNGAPGTPITGGGISNTPAISNAETGFNLQLGLAYNTELGNNWALQTGLQYQYLTNKQGLKADTTTGFTNSFIADNNSFTTNKAHWLQVPITFAYNLRPNSKHQLNILMGSSLAYVVSQEWLISNTNTGRFYYNAAANNKWLLGIHGGLSYTLSKKLSLAAMASYTLTPIQSNVTDKNHFVQYNLQLSTPIRFTNKSSSKK